MAQVTLTHADHTLKAVGYSISALNRLNYFSLGRVLKIIKYKKNAAVTLLC